ncbi:DUF6232 family protein [Streptomyces sp. NPDC058579]|uniref:DUF6232 family protein n=1 Tax=Streptomyces sp. NPDC058579 TaxID=3346548 RepID=UPI003664F701
MDASEASGTPEAPPPPSVPPKSAKPAPAPPQPARPPMPSDAVELKVSKRLLWVGRAAYPLQNVARVHTFTLVPRRGQAFWRFMKRISVTLLLALLLAMVTDQPSYDSYDSYSSDSDGIAPLLWFVVVCAVVYFIGDMLSVVLAKSHFVLAVETSGPSQAVVTSRDRAYLTQLVHTITDALENPDNEFRVQVERVMISKPSNYYFGDAVNMYGSGNVGVFHE